MPRGGHPKSGPTAIDAELRSVRGGRTRPRHERDTNAVPIGVPTKPKHLGAFGSREWNRLVRLLRSENRLTESDRPILMIAATAYESARKIHEACEKETIGAEAWMRLARAERLAWTQLQRAYSDLCLTAATRGRALKPKKEQGGSRLMEFYRRKYKGPA